jgi:RNA polymerase sigma factor (sigma-70 family)
LQEKLKHTSDEALWERYRISDESAFAELFRRHYRKLLHYGLKFTRDQQQAEDCIQELMIRLWTKRTVVNATESVRHYLLKAYRHMLFRKLKQTKIHEEHTEENEVVGAHLSVEDDLIEQESGEQLERNVQALLETLTPRQREILYLRFYQNLTPPEIASMLAINAQSVSNIIQRAFSKIRESAQKTTFNATLYALTGLSTFLWV